MKNNLKPSDFKRIYPWNSIWQKSEYETVLRNIIIILSRTGNKWRKLSWKEYMEERLKDGNFSESEKYYFDEVIEYTITPEKLIKISSEYKKVINEHTRF